MVLKNILVPNLQIDLMYQVWSVSFLIVIKKQWELFSEHYLFLFFPHLGLVNLLSDSGDQSLIVKKKKKKLLLQVRRQVPEQLHWFAYATTLILDLDEQEKYPCYIKDYFKLQVKSPNHSWEN